MCCGVVVFERVCRVCGECHAVRVCLLLCCLRPQLDSQATGGAVGGHSLTPQSREPNAAIIIISHWIPAGSRTRTGRSWGKSARQSLRQSPTATTSAPFTSHHHHLAGSQTVRAACVLLACAAGVRLLAQQPAPGPLCRPLAPLTSPTHRCSPHTLPLPNLLPKHPCSSFCGARVAPHCVPPALALRRPA